MPIIRPAQDSDVPMITEIHNHALVHTTSNWDHRPVSVENRAIWLKDRQAAGFPVLIAGDPGEVLGFASYGPFRPHSGYRHTVEHSVYVHPDAQGRGLGRLLLGALVDEARAQGLHVMVGAIEAGNTGSVALHRKLGFEVTGTLPQTGTKFGRWLDLVFMTLILSDREPDARP